MQPSNYYVKTVKFVSHRNLCSKLLISCCDVRNLCSILWFFEEQVPGTLAALTLFVDDKSTTTLKYIITCSGRNYAMKFYLSKILESLL